MTQINNWIPMLFFHRITLVAITKPTQQVFLQSHDTEFLIFHNIPIIVFNKYQLLHPARRTTYVFTLYANKYSTNLVNHWFSILTKIHYYRTRPSNKHLSTSYNIYNTNYSHIPPAGLWIYWLLLYMKMQLCHVATTLNLKTSKFSGRVKCP